MVLLYTFLFAAAASAKCFESTAHPPPDLDPNDALLKHAFTSIESALQLAAADPRFAATSFSVEVTSSKKPLWSQHHTALARNVSRPDIPVVNGDALYRIASISKTFTVLGLLYQHQAGNLSLDDPIDEYIEELKEDQKGTIPWKDITLRSLASQLSGIPREFAQGDLINFDNLPLKNPVDYGLPPMSREGLCDCDEYSPNFQKACSADDLLREVKSKTPLFAPNAKSSYSNIAFELLGLVLTRVTNQTYESYIKDAIFTPLNMSKSTLSLPPDSAGVIPMEPHYWDVDEGIQNPTGGIYTSANDMSKYMRYILTHYNALATGVNWFNPVSPSQGMYSHYGMPWEMFQTNRILEDSQRTVRFITKGGGLPGYSSMIVLIPEYDLGITILVAGNGGLFGHLLEAIGQPLVRAAEAIAIRQLNERYVGTYASTDKKLNSSITLVADSRGLVVTEFISNGTNIFDSEIPRLWVPGTWYSQLVPTLLYRDEKKQQGELWRMLKTDDRVEGSGSIWDDFCATDYDHPMYAGTAYNEFAFWDQDGDEKFQTLELSAFRVNLTRTNKKKSGGVWDAVQEVLEL